MPTMKSLACLQAMEVRIAAARAVARQWFGVLMRPRTPADAWLVEGLAGYFADLFLRRFLGKNELRFRSGTLPTNVTEACIAQIGLAVAATVCCAVVCCLSSWT